MQPVGFYDPSFGVILELSFLSIHNKRIATEKQPKQLNMKIWISGFWANGVARPTKNHKLSPFGDVLQPVGFYDPMFGVI